MGHTLLHTVLASIIFCFIMIHFLIRQLAFYRLQFPDTTIETEIFRVHLYTYFRFGYYSNS